MKPLHGWLRDLHLYLGLCLSPAVLIFAVSTLSLNHPRSAPPAEASNHASTTPPAAIAVSGEAGSLEQARSILRQLHVTGEIDYVRHDAKAGRLVIPVTKPGQRTEVAVDLRAGTAVVERREEGLAAALIYLHKMPGPHNAQFRGNWLYMAWWSALADAVVYGILAVTLSGLYLWWRLRPQRGLGWLMLGMGALSATALVLAICTA